MITEIREKLLKGKAFKVAVWVLLGIIVVFWTGLADKFVGSTTWVVRVNGQEVGYNQFMLKAMDQENQIQAFRQQNGKYADALLQSLGINLDPKILALEVLVREILMTQAGHKLGVQISDAFITEKLMDQNFVRQELSDLVPLYAFDPARGINQQQLRTYLRRAGMSMDDFEKHVNEALVRHVLLECMVLASYVPEFELRQKFMAEDLGKKLSILSFSSDIFLAKAQATKATPQELQEFYEMGSRQQKYWVPEKRSVVTWTFPASTYPVVVNEPDITAYYDEHKADFVEKPAQMEVRRILFTVNNEAEAKDVYQKAKSLLDELQKDPSQFEAKAKELSQDKESASKGGLLPAFAKGAHEPVFDRTAFSLQKDGEIAKDIVRTSKGLEIIQRVTRTNATYKPLSAVRKEIQSALLQKTFAQQFAHDIKKITKEQDVISHQDLDKKSFEAFRTEHANSSSSQTDIEQGASKLAQMAFSLKEGEMSFYVDGDKALVVQVTKVAKRHLPSLDVARESVEHDFYLAKADKLMAEQLQSAKNMSHQKSFQELAKEFGVPLSHTDMLKKTDVGKLATLRGQGMPIDTMLHLERAGMVAAFKKDRNAYLVHVDEVEEFDTKSFTSKKSSILATAEQEKMRSLADSFVASLYRNATIKPNESLFNQGPAAQGFDVESLAD